MQNIDKGQNYPNEFNAVIEITANSSPVKYEVCKDSGLLEVDRFIPTGMVFPVNYGFIPTTMAEDGDPIDVLVITRFPIVNACVIKVRPIGVLLMEDEAGIDSKILCVPVSKLDKFYDNIHNPEDLPSILLDQISHFFEYYKKLEANKWVKIKGWANQEIALSLLK